MELAQGTAATAFGLDVQSDHALSFLAGARAKPTGRSLAVTVAGGEQTGLQWPSGAELICDERLRGGAVNFRIEKHPDAGYLIHGPEYGAHLLAADGRRLRCFPNGLPEEAWQRMLVAQVLPFAALLHGLEVFHASTVARAGEAIAFLGPSRSGKTSLALELCARGADFLADDVLAVESRAGTLLANPGSPIAGVARASTQGGGARLPGEVISVNDRERMVRISGAVDPTPLTTLFFIDRRSDGPESPEFRPAADAQMLLAATFNFVLATPERLQGLLDVCALAARLRVELVTIGPATSTSTLADALERHLSAPA